MPSQPIRSPARNLGSPRVRKAGTPSSQPGCCTFQDCMAPAQRPGSAYPKALSRSVPPYHRLRTTISVSLSPQRTLRGPAPHYRHHVGSVLLGSTCSSNCSAPCGQRCWRPSSGRQALDALRRNSNHVQRIADFATSGTSAAGHSRVFRPQLVWCVVWHELLLMMSVHCVSESYQLRPRLHVGTLAPGTKVLYQGMCLSFQIKAKHIATCTRIWVQRVSPSMQEISQA